MSQDYETGIPKSVLRSAGVIAAIIALGAIIWVSPAAYRWLCVWFLLVSAGVGVGIAFILSYWHKVKPVKEEDLGNKRPLGLD